jgi:hypothetical protein
VIRRDKSEHSLRRDHYHRPRFHKAWTVKKNYLRGQVEKPARRESICAEGNPWLKIGGNSYFLSANGRLMPTRKSKPHLIRAISRSWQGDRQTREGRGGDLISTVGGTPRRIFFDHPNAARRTIGMVAWTATTSHSP